MKFIAHRGESLAAPENTLESFNLAWARGAIGIEGDFHLTRDGYIVCMHDDNAKRTGGVDRQLADMTLAEIEQLDVGCWKGREWKHTRVPTLEAVLNTIPPHGKIYVELKCADGIVEKIKRVFAASQLKTEQLILISFYEDVIRAVKKELPSHKAFLLMGIEQDKTTGKPLLDADGLIAKLRALHADGVDCCAQDFLDREWIGRVRQAGLEFHVWTVDDVREAKKFIKYGVDSITTNCAYILQEETK